MNRRELIVGAAAMVAQSMVPLPQRTFVSFPWFPEPRLDDARLVLPDSNRFLFYTDGD